MKEILYQLNEWLIDYNYNIDNVFVARIIGSKTLSKKHIFILGSTDDSHHRSYTGIKNYNQIVELIGAMKLLYGNRKVFFKISIECKEIIHYLLNNNDEISKNILKILSDNELTDDKFVAIKLML